MLTAAEAQVYRNLTLTEIGFNTPAGNNEYVEVFNLSYTETLDLYNVRIKYAGVNTDTVVPVGMNALLPPRTYAVIFEGDYDFVNGMYKNIVPPGAVVVKLHGTTFGASGMSNTTDKAITLISPYGDSLETYTYTANNSEGYSDEKRVLNNDNSSGNWGNARRFAGTPGGNNSILARLKNLSIGSFTLTPSIIFPDTRVSFKLLTYNYGLVNSNDAVLQVHWDKNFDSTGWESELLLRTPLSGIAAGDSGTLSMPLLKFPEGTVQLLVEIIYPGDEDTVDNKTAKRFTVLKESIPPRAVIINEFMPNPGTKGNEWVELYNRTDKDISLKNWTIHDRVNSAVISTQNVTIRAKNYIILSRDSSYSKYYPYYQQIQIMDLPILNNDEDVIALNDSLGMPIDRVEYVISGSTPGISQEKINPDTVTTYSADWVQGSKPYYASPGRINYATPKRYDAAIVQLKLLPNPLMLSQMLTAAVTIKNIGLNPMEDLYLAFYRDEDKDSIPDMNEFVKQIYLQRIDTGAVITVNTELFEVWQSEVRIICNLLPGDDNNLNNSAYSIAVPIVRAIPKNAIVINEIQAEPKAPYQEWVEIYNTTADPIDLMNLRFSDANDTVRISTKPFILNSKQYAVLARDSSINKLYKGIKNLAVCSLPQLNNDGDNLSLLDSLGFPVDFVPYKKNWGTKLNYSLEKIIESRQGSDSIYWRSSESRWYGTPGYINSVTEKTRDAFIISSDISPLLPAKGDTVTIRLLIGCTPYGSLQVSFYEDLDSNGTPDTRLALFTASVNYGSSPSLFTVPYKIYGLNRSRYFYASVAFTNDQDTANNGLFLRITPGYPAGAVRITEIMANPLTGRPEWIEVTSLSADTVNMSGWNISDVLSFPSSVEIPAGVVCPPQKRIIFTTDSINAYYPMPGVKQYIINLPALNNDADGVVLHDYRGLAIDSVYYSYPSAYDKGKSMEKFNISLPGAATYNWEFSRDRKGGTPGRINSVEPKQTDVTVVSVLTMPQFPGINDTGKVQISFRNDGLLQSPPGEGVFRIPVQNKESFIQIPLLSRSSVYTADVPVLFTDSVVHWELQSTFSNDEDPLNNNFTGSLIAGIREGSVIISEIVPVSDMSNFYWFELYNASGTTINLQNWVVSFIRGGTSFPLSTKPLLMDPGTYKVFSPDTLLYTGYGLDPFPVYSMPRHSGNINTLLLTDSRGALQDSFYAPGLSPLPRVSWERSRINGQSFWSLPINGYTASPGQANSVTRVQPPKKGSVVINEIMYQPVTGNPEYIELLNAGSTPVDLPLLMFEKEGTAAAPFISVSGKLFPGAYCILTADSLFRQKYTTTPPEAQIIVMPAVSGLRAENLALIIKSIDGSVVDSIRYSSSFHNKKYTSTTGRSLERISSSGGTEKENWSSNVSPTGNTAGFVNSIGVAGTGTTGKLSFSPNPFSPDDDGYEDFCVIRYSLPAVAASLNLTLYDDRGRIVRKLMNDLPAPANGEYIFNGKDNGGRSLPIGQYIIYLEAVGLNGSTIAKEKGVVVITKGR